VVGEEEVERFWSGKKNLEKEEVGQTTLTRLKESA